MNWKKARSTDLLVGRTLVTATVFPYQISLGFSLGYFEGFRVRLYFLCFKLAIDELFPPADPAQTTKKEGAR